MNHKVDKPPYGSYGSFYATIITNILQLQLHRTTIKW